MAATLADILDGLVRINVYAWACECVLVFACVYVVVMKRCVYLFLALRHNYRWPQRRLPFKHSQIHSTGCSGFVNVSANTRKHKSMLEYCTILYLHAHNLTYTMGICRKNQSVSLVKVKEI